MDRNNKTSIIGYLISLLSFAGALFLFFKEAWKYGNIFLVVGGILLTLTSIHKIVTGQSRNRA